jgi:hypothetical protein
MPGMQRRGSRGHLLMLDDDDVAAVVVVVVVPFVISVVAGLVVVSFLPAPLCRGLYF